MSELVTDRIMTHAERLGLTDLAGEAGVFDDDALATAILDRLLHYCEVITINGPWFRLKDQMRGEGGDGQRGFVGGLPSPGTNRDLHRVLTSTTRQAQLRREGPGETHMIRHRRR